MVVGASDPFVGPVLSLSAAGNGKSEVSVAGFRERLRGCKVQPPTRFHWDYDGPLLTK